MFLGIEVKKKFSNEKVGGIYIGIEGKEPLLISSGNFQTLYNQRYLFEYSKLVVFLNYNIHYCWQVVLECSLH